MSSLRLVLGLIFVAFPLLEIALLIKAGETLGFWPTITILLAAAALGIIVIQEKGLSVVGRMFAAMNEGRFPLEPLLDSYVVILAGFLLIMPGFLSDLIGLALLVPPVRRLGVRWAVSGLVGSPQASKPERPIVIEGTYERVDEDNGDSKKEP